MPSIPALPRQKQEDYWATQFVPGQAEHTETYLKHKQTDGKSMARTHFLTLSWGLGDCKEGSRYKGFTEGTHLITREGITHPRGEDHGLIGISQPQLGPRKIL